MSYAPAINELQIKRDNNLNNAPINEREGKLKQAALERKIAESCSAAMEALKKSPTMRRLKHK